MEERKDGGIEANRFPNLPIFQPSNLPTFQFMLSHRLIPEPSSESPAPLFHLR